MRRPISPPSTCTARRRPPSPSSRVLRCSRGWKGGLPRCGRCARFRRRSHRRRAIAGWSSDSASVCMTGGARWSARDPPPLFSCWATVGRLRACFS
jgi:hypothetical protein